MDNIIGNDITYLHGVGPKKAALLNRLGVYTVGDLLRLYPRSYIDLTNKSTFAKTADDGAKHAYSVIILTDPSKSIIRKNLTLFKFRVTDGQDDALATIYNDRYTAMKLHRGESCILYGRVQYKKGFIMQSPQIIDAGDASQIRPVYPQTAGLSSKAVERLVRSALTECRPFLTDIIPLRIRMEYGLCSYQSAIEEIHFPKAMQSVAKASNRLIFEELMIWQIAMGALKTRIKTETGAVCRQDFTPEIISRFSFELTNAQKRAVKQISDDMSSGKCMNRLLQGDVGSGKTAVAVAAAYNAAKNGFQTALMAPTELLAVQHYNTVAGLLEKTDISLELLTGGTTEANRRRIYAGLADGSTDIVVGTHALISKGVEFNNLGLVITDEQHRFGVAQRGELAARGHSAHLLAMSATPIPRTLALTVYGDLDLSVLDELPEGRQKVETYRIDSSKRIRAFNYIKKHLDEGGQGYIVCALVEENDSQLLAATEYFERLREKYFAGYSLGLLHGRMRPAQKEQVMSDFAAGKIQLLISTTVIEVGMDVPDAVIMMIENAERFGLSQLHQLRGRVGRGTRKSTCILVSDSRSELTTKRLNAVCRTNDGFEIAAEDLKLRGPGDFFGVHQHGFLPFSIADIERDIKTVELSHEAAELLLSEDPALIRSEHRGMRDAVERAMKRFESA